MLRPLRFARIGYSEGSFISRNLNMAILTPDNRPPLRKDAGLFRELEVLDRLQSSLPDNFEIFHSVDWHTIRNGEDRHGEIDIVIMGPRGNLLLMEVKAGAITIRDGEMYKRYETRERDVGAQCRVQYSAMRNRLQEAKLHSLVTNCLVLPDYVVGTSQIISLPPDRIIDAQGYGELGSRVKEMLSIGNEVFDREALRHFLKGEFRVSTNLEVLRDQLAGTAHTLADGMSTWVPRIHAPSGVVRILATAGSGKTQLAIQLLENAVAAGQSALYVCYNRPLADHMNKVAPPRSQVASFHELCVEHYRRTCHDPNFEDPRFFSEATAIYQKDSTNLPLRFDVIIVDEAQDFDPDWMACLTPQLKEDGRLYVMEDDDQRLYDRDAFDIPEAVTITCRDNYRTPQTICQAINAFSLATTAVVSRNPFRGDPPGFHVYASPKELVRQTALAVDDLLSRGFAISDIVVLTAHGRAKSILLNEGHIGAHTTRRFSGKFSKNSDPIWIDGELLVESIFRFKGQSAPAIVISELDFSELTSIERKKLFVGITRAQMAVEIVIGKEAERYLAERLKH